MVPTSTVLPGAPLTGELSPRSHKTIVTKVLNGSAAIAELTFMGSEA